jgi:ribosomal protein S30
MGIFNRWLKSKDKLGGQHKVPRLANHRQYIEEILKIQQERPLDDNAPDPLA